MIQTDLYSFSYKKGTLVPFCKRCGNEKFWKDGKSCEHRQLYRCTKCGFRFVWISDLPNRRFFSNVISFATDIYVSLGVGLRTLARKMLQYFGVKVSHEAIRKWVLQDKAESFVDNNLDNAQTWHCDETYIKVKGRGVWLWIVYCKETRQVLSWHISKTHLLKDAITVLRTAKQKVGKRPEKIVSDGLWQYETAIKKVMGWHWKEQKARYVKDSGIGKNAYIERVNKEIKRRTKWFGSFQSLKGAESFFKLFFSIFNKRTALARSTG